MKNGMKVTLIVVTVFGLAAASAAAKNPNKPTCTNVSGKLIETQIVAPDAVGRVLGEVTGVLNGSETAHITNIPLLDPVAGIATAETVNVFVTGPGDTLYTTGVADVRRIGPSPGTVSDELILTIDPVLSTGKYSGATGTIELDGIGFNFPFFSPDFGPGITNFDFNYKGEICYASE